MDCTMTMQFIHFNPRSREGSDRPQYASMHWTWKFQSTLPRRERLSQLSLSACLILFQSTLPRRERPAYRTSVTPTPKFQSTLPRRERPQYGIEIVRRRAFQSTLPRRERLIGHSRTLLYPVISIHAPAKGATLPAHSIACDHSISIHAPAKGATTAECKKSIAHRAFQSTLPRRERP